MIRYRNIIRIRSFVYRRKLNILEKIGAILMRNMPTPHPNTYGSLTIRSAQTLRDVEESIRIYNLSFNDSPPKKIPKIL